MSGDVLAKVAMRWAKDFTEKTIAAMDSVAPDGIDEVAKESIRMMLVGACAHSFTEGYERCLEVLAGDAAAAVLRAAREADGGGSR